MSNNKKICKSVSRTNNNKTYEILDLSLPKTKRKIKPLTHLKLMYLSLIIIKVFIL
jgi:hypothetical protein